MEKEAMRDLEELEFDLHKLSSVLWISLQYGGVEEDVGMLIGLARDVIDRVREDLDKHSKVALAAYADAKA